MEFNKMARYMAMTKYCKGTVPNKYAPHQGAAECARRVRQGKAGQGTVRLAHERD